MRQPVIDQLISTLVSILSGMCFGLLYDFFKAFRLRLKRRWFTFICDVLCCIVALCLLFLLFMTVGNGVGRLYIIGCAVVGGVFYFSLLSRFLLTIFSFFVGLAAKTVHFIGVPIKFLLKKAKLLFQKAHKGFRMKAKGETAPETGEEALEGETYHETQTSKPNNKNRHTRSGRVRRDNPVLPEAANRGRRGKAK